MRISSHMPATYNNNVSLLWYLCYYYRHYYILLRPIYKLRGKKLNIISGIVGQLKRFTILLYYALLDRNNCTRLWELQLSREFVIMQRGPYIVMTPWRIFQYQLPNTCDQYYVHLVPVWYTGTNGQHPFHRQTFDRHKIKQLLFWDRYIL